MSMDSFRLVASSLKITLSTCMVLGSILLGASDALAQKKSQRVPQDFTIIPISVNSVTVENGQLVAHGLVGTNEFSSPITVGTRQQAGACPILDLRLGPIDLNLLGLQVDTSAICLAVTAYEGGGLLGDLLCNVANLLQGGALLGDVLTSLEASGELERFLNGLTSLFDGALDVVTDNNPTALQASCSVLSLSVGPLNLNLLGLEVRLNNCQNGPVTVDITAVPGGGLLGDLLCNLTNVLNSRTSPVTAVQALLWQISRVLAGLVG
jgi:hypothetical protein